MKLQTNLAINGQVELGNPIALSSVGTLNNLANDNSSIIRFTNASPTIITGLVASSSYKILQIVHQGAGSLTLAHQSGTSDPANRIITPTNSDIILSAGQVATLLYDPTATRWVISSVSSGGGSGGGGGGAGVSYTINSAPIGLSLGMPVYWDGTKYAPARANNKATLATAVVSELNGGDYTVQYAGVLTLSNAQWDAITGGSGGLSIASTSNKYYLSDATAGRFIQYVPPLAQPILVAINNSGGNSTAEVKFGVQALESGQGDTFLRNQFTGDDIETEFILDSAPAGIDYTWIYLDGIYQIPNIAFTLSGATISFSDPPPAGVTISVMYARAMMLADVNSVNRMTAFSEIVTGSPKNTFNLPTTPSGVHSLIVFVGGAIQDQTQYSLSGNVLTTLDAVSVGTQIIAFTLNSSGVSNSIDAFVTREVISIADIGIISIEDLFGSQTSGLYRFFDMEDPRINVIVGLKHNGTGIDPDISLFTASSSISSIISNPSTLNFYITSNILRIENRLGRVCQLRAYKET